MSRTMRDEAAAIAAEKARAAEAAAQEGLQAAAELPGSAAEAAEAEAQAAAEAAAEDIAIREQTAITFGSLLPSPTWAAAESLGKARGVQTSLGRIRGTVIGTERKSTMFGGKILESIALLGDFHAIARLREAEVLHGSMLFLTNTYSQQIERALAHSADTGEVVAIDVDVGFETTGKSPVSYAWTITHYLNGGPSRAIRELLAPRRPRGPGGAPLVAMLTREAPGVRPIQEEVDRILATGPKSAA
jgi:hypothetical protein